MNYSMVDWIIFINKTTVPIWGDFFLEVTLKNITLENWEECIRLQLREDQVNFVAPNWYSILQSQYEPSYVPKAVYFKDQMVGFFMYGKDPVDERYWIVRLMIDKEYQGSGLGRMLLFQGIKLIRSMPDCSPEIITSYKPNNDVVGNLYASVGFEKTGEIIDGEIVVSLQVKQ